MSVATARNGSVLIASIILLAIMSALAVCLATASTTNLQVADNHRAANRAFASAESGLEIMRYWLGRVEMPSTTPPEQYFNTLIAMVRDDLQAAGVSNFAVDPSGRIPTCVLESITGERFGGQWSVDPNDPTVPGNANIDGILYIEVPNNVTFVGNINLRGIIVAEGDVNDPGGNQITLGDPTTPQVPSNFVSGPYPPGEEFDAMRCETCSCVLAPGFAVSFWKNISTLHILAYHQLPNLFLLDRGLGLELEGIQRLDHWEAGVLDSPLGGPLLPVQRFPLDETKQQGDVVTVVFGPRGALQTNPVRSILPATGQRPENGAYAPTRAGSAPDRRSAVPGPSSVGAGQDDRL